MTKDRFNHRSRTHAASAAPSLRELAEAGAQGRRLTQAETIAICEALRARGTRSPNQFHSGT